MNYFEIKPDGQAYIRTDSGTVLRKVGDGNAVNHADFNKKETLFAITYSSGKSEIRDRKNKLVRTLAENGVEKAFMKENSVLLILNDGSQKSIDL